MRSSRLAITVCLSIGIWPQVAYAAGEPGQDLARSAGPAEGRAGTDDIVVTARRTAERLQDVPVAVTAITPDMIEKRNMRTLADIQAITPSLVLTTQNAVGSKAAVALRGQRQSASGISVDGSVATYVNELYMARTSIDTAMYDLESVQVLKGPQGTLFGRNSTGGAILVSTKKPGDYFGGYVRGQLETPYSYVTEAAINVPLGEGNGLRVAGYRQYRRGYTKVLGFSTRGDDRDRFGLRATLKITSGDLESLFIGDYYKWNENGTVVFPLARVPGVNGTPATGALYAAFDAAFAEADANDWTRKRIVRTSGPLSNPGRNYSAVNITDYRLSDAISIKNVIGIAATRDYSSVDLDGTVAPILYSPNATGQHQFSEEIQMQGKSFDNRLEWVTGLYYFRESGFDEGLLATFLNPVTTTARAEVAFDAANSAYSGFVHGSYLLPIEAPAHIFGGVRKGHDRREVTFRSGNRDIGTGAFTCLTFAAPALTTPGAACATTRSKNYSSTTWDIGLDVKPIQDLLLYGSVSRGFRTGGFNGRAVSPTNGALQNPFNPEKVTNYELGLKFSGDVGRMRTTVNIAGYHSLYNNIQQTVNFVNPANNSIASNIINAANARLNGVEVELSVRPVRTLTLSGFYSFIDAKYLEFTQATATGTQDLSKNKFAGVPRNTGGAAAAWDAFQKDGFGSLQFNLNMRFSDGYEIQPINVVGGRIKSFDVWNSSVRLDHAFGTRASLELYVKNLLDKTYASGGLASQGLGFAVRTLADPRIVGVGLRLPFGDE